VSLYDADLSIVLEIRPFNLAQILHPLLPEMTQKFIRRERFQFQVAVDRLSIAN
jgi:hypothetical protein